MNFEYFLELHRRFNGYWRDRSRQYTNLYTHFENHFGEPV